jgi:RNA polymerase sigma-70 factor (ECF subfamily)
LDEGQLITRAVAGDARAERALYDAHVDRVYRLAYRMAGEASLAEEFTQETFLRAFERLATFRREAAFSSWLYAIGVSVAINHLRKQRRRREHERGWEETFPLQDPGKDNQIELRRRLHRAIDDLPEEMRTVFLMHDLEGYRHREIGEILSIPEGTSKARLHHARNRLRGALGYETRRASTAREVEAPS